MRFGPYSVKHSPRSGKSAPNWSRWLEGWGLLFPSVGVALLAAWLALPQGTMPDYLPLPRLSQLELDRAKRQWRSEANAVRQHPLDYDVRAIGESIRILGRLTHSGESLNGDRREQLRAAIQQVRIKTGTSQLGQLRAVQGQFFLDALAAWEQTGVENLELVELGGDFIRIATELSWVVGPKPVGASNAAVRRRLLLDEDERLALFITRWSDLAGVKDDAELRLAPVWPMLALRARLRLPLAQLGQRDFALIDRVSALLPEYPTQLTKGLLYIRLGNHSRAIEALQAHLEAHPDGPYRLRARNHLVYALEQLDGNGS